MADVERDHLCGSPTQQHIAESSRRGTDIQAMLAFNRGESRWRERVECSQQLECATRHIIVFHGHVHTDGRFRLHCVCRLCLWMPVDVHLACFDQTLCLGSRFTCRIGDHDVETLFAHPRVFIFHMGHADSSTTRRQAHSPRLNSGNANAATSCPLSAACQVKAQAARSALTSLGSFTVSRRWVRLACACAQVARVPASSTSIRGYASLRRHTGEHGQ